MPIPRVVDADTAILRLQQSVNRASRTRFMGCFSLYLSMGNMTAQTNKTKPNKTAAVMIQTLGTEGGKGEQRRVHALMSEETRMTMNV